MSLALEVVPELLPGDPDEATARVERAIDSLHLSIQDIRNFIFGLRPGLLEGVAVIAGLASLVEEQRHNTITELQLRVAEGVQEPPPAVAGQLLAIANETISNVVRHARASVATVALRPLDGSGAGWELTIEDNGRGFDPATVARVGHQGLANTRDRVAQIGGSVSLESRVGEGTRVVVRVPAGPGERTEEA